MVAAEQLYRYPVPSVLDGDALLLATSGGRTSAGPAAHPRFFEGFLTHPAVVAQGILAVAAVASTRYLQLPSERRVSLDPVITSDGGRLRLESLSGCAGVYARLDLLGDVLDGNVLNRGTTNVDVNEPLRRLLTVVRDTDAVHVAVGADELAVSTVERSAVERKVPLPTRWLRGFAEAQQLASGFDIRMELGPAAAVRLARELTRTRGGWLVPAGSGARLSGRPAPGAVHVSGGVRLESLLPLLRFATSLRWYGPVVGSGSQPTASACELDLGNIRYTLMLSPDPARGLSGEGASLDDLASDAVSADAELVGALLDFEPRVDLDDLTDRAGLVPARIRAALAA